MKQILSCGKRELPQPPATQETPGLIPGSERSPREGIGYPLQYFWASLVAQLVKNLPVMQDTLVQSLSQEDPLEKGMATYSSVLAWRIPWTEEPGGLQFMGSQSMTERLSLSLSKGI